MGGVCTMYTHEMQLHTYKPNNTCRRKLRWLKNVCCGNQRNWTFLGMKFNMYKQCKEKKTVGQCTLVIAVDFRLRYLFAVLLHTVVDAFSRICVILYFKIAHGEGFSFFRFISQYSIVYLYHYTYLAHNKMSAYRAVRNSHQFYLAGLVLKTSATIQLDQF